MNRLEEINQEIKNLQGNTSMEASTKWMKLQIERSEIQTKNEKPCICGNYKFKEQKICTKCQTEFDELMNMNCDLKYKK